MYIMITVLCQVLLPGHCGCFQLTTKYWHSSAACVYNPPITTLCPHIHNTHDIPENVLAWLFQSNFANL